MPKALVFYQYFHPDDVVSAQHYADLCLGLKDRGWDVGVMPCNRGCRDESLEYPRKEIWNGIEIRRIWRPAFRQASQPGRILNSIWMLMAWSLAALRHRPDVVIIGTDPIFAVMAAIPWRFLRPGALIFHWCFDLHPETAVADGIFTARNPVLRVARWFLRAAYRCCDLVGSIGNCMSRRLRLYDSKMPIQIYTPWALLEPSASLRTDPQGRREVFGDAELALMYSGSFGRAHAFDEILALARELRDQGARLVFSVRGNRGQALREAVTAEDTNIAFVEFAPRDQLEERLSAADIQIVSLREEFCGTVVPSKFQGSIASGRPILFAGPPDSSVGQWIQEFGLGWIITKSNVREVAAKLLQWKSDVATREAHKEHCFRIYQDHFSKDAILNRLDAALKENLPLHRHPPGA